MIFMGMKEKQYYDKFMQDMEKKEALHKQHRESLQIDTEEWEKRRELERRYREHSAQRIRYQK